LEVLRNFVDGRFADPVSDVVDPGHWRGLRADATSGPQDMAAALRVAGAAFDSWRGTAPAYALPLASASVALCMTYQKCLVLKNFHVNIT
jgi:hypothetical protein